MRQKHHTFILTKFSLLVFICISICVVQSKAQNTSAVFTGCASDQFLHNHSTLEQEQQSLDSLAYQYLSTHPHHGNNTFAVAYIPVVVHIIHNNGPENITDAQVHTALANINAKFLANNNYHIQFCLAQQDPQGNATTGITRDISSLTTETMEIDDINLKDINRWPPRCYMNIWVIKEILSVSMGSAVVGYATFPSSAGQNNDGFVIEANYFGSSTTNDAVGTHEIGHYLGLYHTFQGGCTNNNCLMDGDHVCDTPPDQTTFASCVPPSNSCSTDADDPSANNPFNSDVPDLGEDYMDYSNFTCYNQFTPGQYSRMQFFLSTARNSLLNCIGCNTPCPNPISATITNPSSNQNLITGATVNFAGTSVNSSNLQWYINSSTILSTTNSLSYTFNSPGTFWVKFTAISSDPTHCNNGIDSIKIVVSEPVVVACGGSIKFDDTNPAVDLPLSNQYYTGTNGGYTWECWFKFDQLPTGTEARPLISSIDAVTYEDMFLGFGWDGGVHNSPVSELVFKVDGPSMAFPSDLNCTYTPPGGFLTGVWYHAAGVANYTTQTKKLYLNGTLVDTEVISYPPNTRSIISELSFDYPWAPAFGAGPRPLYGNMDEVRIWTTPKTDAEIAANYNQCMAGNEANLFLYYRCNQAAGSTVVDATANSNTGTFTQAPLWSVDNAPGVGAACVAACLEICGNGIDDNNNGQVDEGCACPTINLGNDTLICSAASVQLDAGTQFTNYSWLPTTGLSNPSISNPVASPSATTTYTVTATTPGPNLIVNPDFSAGNMGFTSGQLYSTVYSPCNYYVGPLFFIYNYNMPDHTPTSDNMYMSIDGCSNAPTMIWEQQVFGLQNNTNYTFSFWATRADVTTPIFEIHFIGDVTGDVVVATNPGITYPGGGLTYWDQYGVASWNSGANTNVTIKIVNLETNGNGNDFGIDDLLFGKICSASDTIKVSVVTNSAPLLELGNDISICATATHTFDAGAGHMTYLWNDGSDLQTFSAHEPGTYWVSVTDSCGAVQRDTVHITLAPSPSLILPNDTSLCIGDSLLLGYNTNGTYTNLLWYPTTGLNCTACPAPVVHPTTTTKYYLVASTSDGCTNMDSITVNLFTNVPISVITSSPCDSTTGNLLIGAVTGGSMPYQYNFNNLGFSSVTSYSGLSTNNYPLTIKDNHGCSFDTTVHVAANQIPPSTLSYSTTNIQCNNSGAVSIGNVTGGTPPYQFNFNNQGFSADTLFTGLQANSYTVIVKDSAGCLLTVPISISVDYSAPHSTTIFTTDFTCEMGGTALIVNIAGGTSPYVFSLNQGDFQSFGQFSNLNSGNYNLSILDSNNCALDTSFIIKATIEDEVVYIPNCFTPNGDVNNEHWSVKGNCIKSIDCKIFNRWGEEIIHLQKIDEYWDGTHKGTKVQDGVYFYVVDIIYYSENTERKSGSVSVFR